MRFKASFSPARTCSNRVCGGSFHGIAAWRDSRFAVGELHRRRDARFPSIWNGHVTAPKTGKGRAPVPLIRQLAERLELHRLRCGDPESSPVFANTLGNLLNMNNLGGLVILPSLNRCAACSKSEEDHSNANHQYKRDERIPRRHGWHAARRGLGSNLYRLGVPDIVIQRILRHANVSTSAKYYIKTAANDVRSAMAK